MPPTGPAPITAISTSCLTIAFISAGFTAGQSDTAGCARQTGVTHNFVNNPFMFEVFLSKFAQKSRNAIWWTNAAA
jgi:hypothetical protein